MEEADQVAPGKRKRIEDSDNELQKIIKEKDNVIEGLNVEIDKLRRRVDELVKTMHGSFFIKDASNLNDTPPATSQENTKQKKLKKRKKKIPIESGHTEAKGISETEESTDFSAMEVEDVRRGKMAAGLVPKGEKAKADWQYKGTERRSVRIPTGTEGANGMDTENNRSPHETTPTSQGTRVAENVVSKCKKIPIITTYNINVKEMTGVIDRTLGHKNYNIRIMGKNATNIGVCTLKDFEALKALLRERGVNFYTYTPREQKPFSVVIEGLSGTYTDEDILDYLKGLGIKIDVLGLVRLNNDRWLLRLSRDSDLSAFYSVRYVLRCRVYMRKYKRGAITQCFNCQRFGHVSTNCQMPYRCVKCGASHGPGKCEIPKKGENTRETLVTDPVTGQAVRKIGLPVKCVNCNVVGHAASSKECPRRLALLEKVQRKRVSREENDRSRRPVISTIRSGVTYAAAVASGAPGGASGATVRPNSSTPGVADALSEFDLIDRDCKRFFGGGLLSCFGKIGGFAREYRGLRDDEGRSRALLGMLMLLRQDD